MLASTAWVGGGGQIGDMEGGAPPTRSTLQLQYEQCFLTV